MKITLKKYKYLAAVAIAVIVTVIAVVLVVSDPLLNLNLKFGDRLYGRVPDTPMTIVSIDAKSLDESQGLGPFSSWNRGYFAKVINNINKYKPETVGIDILFNTAKNKETDLELRDAISQIDHPVIIAEATQTNINYSAYFTDLSMPIDILTNLKNVVIGMSNFFPDTDDVYRRLYANMIDQNNTKFDTFAFAIGNNIQSDHDFPPGQSMLINYSYPHAKNINFISFSDVYKEFYGKQNPSKLFNDKIVLIGVTDQIFGDNYSVPVNKPYLMPGVEIHANAIQTILDGSFLREESAVEKMVSLGLLALVMAFVFLYLSLWYSIALAVVVAVAYYFSGPLFFKAGVILDQVYFYIILAATFMVSYLYRYLTEFREKSELKGAFSKYVSPEIVKKIMMDPDKLGLGGESRNISVLFTDIAHFTSISEKLKPVSLVALLNEYFDAMGEVIKEEGGTLDKYEGDAIMAFFGAPMDQPDHAKKACMTALKMRLKLNDLLKSWKENPLLPGGEQKPVIDFRCGVNSGDVIVGNIGAKDRFNYTVMGDSVNLASRLEGANKQYGTNLIISEFTLAQIGDEFIVRELDLIKVVGKEKPVRIFELLGMKADLTAESSVLLNLYAKGIGLYKTSKFEEALHQFEEILKSFPADGPSKLYRQRCEIYRNFPPPADWDGVYASSSK